MIGSPVYTNITFHNQNTSTGEGTHFMVGIYKVLNIWISGTATNHTVTFYEKDPFGSLKPLAGMRTDTTTPALGVNTTGIGEAWQFDIAGKFEIVMSLTAVSGGYVSVEGRAIT